MNVLLISPPAEHVIRGNLPPVVEDCTGAYPSLGLLYVASYAEEVPGCRVRIMDCRAEGIDHAGVERRVAELAPDVVGIQALTFALPDAVLVARAARKAAPKAVIVFGGPHPTIYPGETVALPEADIAVVGEGELVFMALLRALADGSPPENIPGVFTKRMLESGRAAPQPAFIDSLDDLKMPARHLSDNSLYFSPMSGRRGITTMMSSRGCPFRCIFCNRPQMGKRFRKRSAESVVLEMTHCVEKLGVKEIFFYDDTFNVDASRVIDICALIGKAGLKVDWDIRARVDAMNARVLSELAAAGCTRIHYGVESGSPRVMKRLGKDLDIERAREVFKLTRKAGIETLGYFMIGCPDETEDDMKMTFDLLRALPMDYAHIGIFTPFPGTAIYREALEAGVYDNDYWAAFARNPMEPFSPRYWNQHFSDRELSERLKQAYRCFYGRPSYMLRTLLRTRSLSDVAGKARLGFNLLKSAHSRR